MFQPELINVSRRNFLKAGIVSGTGLTLGLYFNSSLANELKSGPGHSITENANQILLEPNAFVRIGTDNTVTVIAKHIEFGQGTFTGLPTLVAEELDAAWEQIKVESAPADATRYNNLHWGPYQGTGGSSAIANSYEQLRNAGATARAMLVNAAAKLWKVSPGSISIQQGVVLHKPSDQSSSFGELAELASKEAIPEKVTLKSPNNFVYIGKQTPRTDSVSKSNGTAIFTQDIQLPNMLTAVVAHPPRFGAKLKSFEDANAKKITGVKDVIAIPSGVAVIANNFWSAKKARDALEIQWDESNAFTKSSENILNEYKQLAKKPGATAHTSGNTSEAFDLANETISASYEFPFLAHAALEPMNCVIQLNNNTCELWYGSQTQSGDQFAVAQILGLPPEKVKINTLFAGGSFGRRANPSSDYVVEAANIAKASKLTNPIKLVWTREDDTQAGYYRPFNYHELKAAIDSNGKITAWRHSIVGQSILTGTAFEEMLVKDGIDSTSVEGAANLPYSIPNMHVDLHSPKLPVPIQWWRSVGHTHTAFSTEVFLDEIAHKIGKDPVMLRRELLKNHPRHLGVLNLAAEKANWGSTLAENKGRGIAVHKSFNSYVAEVAEVTVNENGTYSVDKVTIAVDCGIAINPDVIRAQMEGGMGYGLSTVLSSVITLKDGYVEQSNFDGYQVLRMNQMPEVEVHIVESSENPTGVGEPGTPPIAPAVINAIAAATGKFHRRLPLPLKLT